MKIIKFTAAAVVAIIGILAAAGYLMAREIGMFIEDVCQSCDEEGEGESDG